MAFACPGCRLVWCAVLLACAGAVGCASRRDADAVAPPGRDLVTASDESEASKRARLHMELASAYFSRGQMTTALDEVKQTLATQPTFGGAYNLRGLIYANLGDDALAEESFRRALQLNPRDGDTMQNFGYYLCQKKRYPEANELFDRALAIPQRRDPARTLLTKGVCEAFAGQLVASAATLEQSYLIDPGNPSTAVNLAEVLYRQGDYDRARTYIRRINAVPALTGSQTLWLAARIERRLGNRAAVQEYGEQLRQRFPDSSEAASYDRGRFDE